ncbi:hypothetical protein Vadar_020452 [Vaccinium darrowii]|uniref:Uncharacterized protein n=1 Tax=Vaccinium darrowii TaxID=229202 RepID=A0ACB7XBJ0_9ERIC|nr:hypothetical protein Vadar_020452 [Vaccinium darrowii]
MCDIVNVLIAPTNPSLAGLLTNNKFDFVKLVNVHGKLPSKESVCRSLQAYEGIYNSTGRRIWHWGQPWWGYTDHIRKHKAAFGHANAEFEESESTSIPWDKKRPNPHIFHSTTRQMEGMQDGKPHCTVSLLDFRVAMQLNPQQLGEDWPLLLEKICIRLSEE